MRTTNPNLEFPKATFTEPTPYGYIYAGIIVDPPGRAPFVRGSSKRNDALERNLYENVKLRVGPQRWSRHAASPTGR